MSDLIRRGLKISHLRLAAALTHETQLSVAAANLRISQPAASRLAAEIAEITGAPLYRRAGRGIELTDEGHTLAMRAERILTEIDAAGRDISELTSGVSGDVRIGGVTGAAIECILPMIRQFRATQPKVRFDVEVGTSDTLCTLVADGRLDMALARLPTDKTAEGFDYRHIGPEPLVIASRQGHPAMARARMVPLRDLLDYEWILPEPGKIMRNTVERTFRQRGLTLPAHVLNTSSFLLVLAMIRQTDAIAPVAASVAAAFASPDGIAILPTDLDLSVEPYGIVTRKSARLSPAAADVFRALCAA